MASIFISYSRADRPFVDDLVPLLRKVYGPDCLWFDDDIHGGADWWQMILDEIADCTLFLYLISNDSLASPYCQSEMREALRLHKLILPVIGRPKTDYPGPVDVDLKLILQNTHYVDLSRGVKDSTALTGLYASAHRLLGQMPPHPPTPLTPEPISQPPVPDKPRRKRQKGLWVAGVGVIVIVVAAIGLWLSGVGHKDEDSGQKLAAEPAETPSQEAMQTDEPGLAPTNAPSPSPTATATLSLTPTQTATSTPTLSATELEQTIAAEMNRALTENARTALAHEAETATAQTATGEAIFGQETQVASDLTATAALWTPTPTPDLRATAYARLTQTQVALEIMATANAEATRTQWVWDQTATATLWTDTPTPTDTPTLTLTPSQTPTLTHTPDPLRAALERAQSFSGNNVDWEKFMWEFDGVEMVLVPAGCFEMGSTQYDDEKPPHRVCFDEPFWIDRTEVTNAQFAALNGQATNASYFSGDNRPREQITWTEAAEFCEGRDARLPTEAEWEYAARGPDALAYPWGDTWQPDQVVWGENSNGQTAVVGSKPAGASWVGALDLSGNVWEWVADWYDAEYYGTLTDGRVNPTGPESGENRVVRGGAWSYSNTFLFRAAYRYGYLPDNGNDDVGFRCARSG